MKQWLRDAEHADFLADELDIHIKNVVAEAKEQDNVERTRPRVRRIRLLQANLRANAEAARGRDSSVDLPDDFA